MTTPVQETTIAQTVPQTPRRKTGFQAIFAAATAITGLALALNPESAVARALSTAIPQLGDAIPGLIAAGGTIVAAFSQPPRLKKQPVTLSPNAQESEVEAKDLSGGTQESP